MAWLGEALGDDEHAAASPFAPRCAKYLVEERLFARQRDLFSDLSVYFMDTRPIYFESKDGAKRTMENLFLVLSKHDGRIRFPISARCP